MTDTMAMTDRATNMDTEREATVKAFYTKEAGNIDVDPKGDVIFVCKASEWGEDKEFRIRVSSVVLMAMSSVFASMLGPHFKEGNLLRTNSTVEIALPDDRPRALILILNVLHLKSAAIPAKVLTVQLPDVAMLADKYLCVEQIGFAAKVWVKAYESTTDPEQLARLMVTSFHLSMAEDFGKFSRALVMSSPEHKDIQSIWHSPVQEEVAERAFVLLDDYKARCFSKIRKFVTLSVNFLTDARDNNPKSRCTGSCHALELSLYGLMRHLRTNQLDAEQLGGQSLGYTLEALKKMPHFPYADVRPCGSPCIIHWLRRRIELSRPNDTFQEQATCISPPPRLLCIEGYHEGGQGKHYSLQCGVGCCKHCGNAGFSCENTSG